MEKLGAVRSAVADGALDGALTSLMCGDLDMARRRVAESVSYTHLTLPTILRV